MNWSWSGFLFGFLFLIHRKAYKDAGIVFLVTAVLSIIIPVYGTLISCVATGVLSLYLLYRRYRSVEANIEASIQERDKRIQSFGEMGGTNILTSNLVMIISTLIILTIIIGSILVFF